jgi:hypothetical protein
MKLPRRRFLQLAAGATALPALSGIAGAQSYPSRPLRLVLGYGPGNAPDIVARLIGQWLSERLGQPCVIDNRPGAGSNISTEAVVRSPADGYTLLYVTTANAIPVPTFPGHALAAALRSDEVVKGVDLGIEQLEGPLPVDAVSAEGGSLARGHRLEEIRAIGTATLLAVTRVDTAFAHCRPAKASRGEIGELTATRHFGPGSYRRIDQKSDSKNDDAQHGRSSGSLSPDCGGVLKEVVRSRLSCDPLNGGSHGASKGCEWRAANWASGRPLQAGKLPAAICRRRRAQLSSVPA